MYRPPTSKTTVGHSHVLPPEERNETAAFAVLNRLLQKAAMRLRKMRHYAGGMAVSVKHVRNTRWGEDCTFVETQDSVEFLRILRLLWERRPAGSPQPLAVSVSLYHLVEEQNRTLPLFEKTSARRDLNATIDLLNACYGKNTVYFGGAHAASKSAPMRIAFNHVPDLRTDAD